MHRHWLTADPLTSLEPIDIDLPFAFQGACDADLLQVTAWLDWSAYDDQADDLHLSFYLSDPYGRETRSTREVLSDWTRFTVTVTFQPLRTGEYNTELAVNVLATDDHGLWLNPTGTFHQIFLEYVVAEGVLAVEPESIELVVPVGCDESASIVLASSPDGVAQLDGVVLSDESDPQWRIEPIEGPLILNGGEDTVVTATYRPGSPGAHTGEVLVSSSNGTVSTVLLEGSSSFPLVATDTFTADGATGSFLLSYGEEVLVDTMVVRVGGVVVGSGWALDSASGELHFHEGNWPTAGTLIQVDYARQHDC